MPTMCTRRYIDLRIYLSPRSSQEVCKCAMVRVKIWPTGEFGEMIVCRRAATVYMVELVIFTFNLSTYGNRERKEKIALLKGKKP